MLRTLITVLTLSFALGIALQRFSPVAAACKCPLASWQLELIEVEQLAGEEQPVAEREHWSRDCTLTESHLSCSGAYVAIERVGQ